MSNNSETLAMRFMGLTLPDKGATALTQGYKTGYFLPTPQ